MRLASFRGQTTAPCEGSSLQRTDQWSMELLPMVVVFHLLKPMQ